MRGLAHHVTREIETSDFKGAIQLAVSEDVLADFDDDTYSALLSKYPTPHPSTCIPPTLLTSYLVISKCVCWWSGQAKPQHLKDLVQVAEIVEDSSFLSVLTDFCSMVLHGDDPADRGEVPFL